MLLTIIKNLTQRPFVRNVAAVAGGTAASQVIVLAFSPLITRLYGPEAYGLQGVFLALVGLLTIVASLGYPTAIVLPESDSDALGLARLSLGIGLVISILATGGLFFFGREILALLNASELVSFIYLIPLAMFISVVAGVLSQWLIRKKEFSLTAKVSVTSSLVTNTVKAGVGFLIPSAGVLIVINTVANLFNSALMLLGLKNRSIILKTFVIGDKSSARAASFAKSYSDFPIWRTPQNLINALSTNLPIVMLANYFGAASVGFYAIANSVLAVPASLIGGSVMQVFYPKVNEAVRRGDNVKALITRTTFGLAFAGLVPLAIVLAAGPFLFSFVFGEEWQKAGVYAQWLSIWLFFQYVNKPAVSAIPALGLQRGLFFYELFSTGSKIGALAVGFVLYRSDVIAIGFFSVVGVIAYIWLILWVIHHAGKLRRRTD